MNLHVDHLDCRYRTPASAAASIVQKRLDAIATSSLARVWENNTGPEDSDKIYFVESLEVDLTLDAFNQDDNLLARTWARELNKGVAQTLRYGGSGVFVFASRAEFLASFLGDLLRGGAWEKWYYREFSLLGSKSTTQAAAAVLTAEPDAGRDALIELTHRNDLDLLLAVLSDSDIELVVDRCLLPSAQRFVLPNRYAGWTDALRRLLKTRRPLLTNNVSRDLARLYLTMLVERPSLGPDVNLARFIYQLLSLRNTIIGLRVSREFLRAIGSEAWNQAFALIADSGQRDFASGLARELGGPQLASLLHELQTAPPEVQTRRIATRYGGLFLLAPAAIKLGLDRFLQDAPYPEPEGAAKDRLLFYLICLQCLGGRNAMPAARDAALPFFAGLAAAPNKTYLERYAATLTDEMHERFRSLFREHLTAVARGNTCRPLDSGKSADHASWFSFEPELRCEKWAQALAPVSRELLHHFASSLGAFAESSPGYLSRNFLECSAEVEVSSEQIAVRFLTCPLQMVLRMAGFDHAGTTVPWLENRELHFRFE